MPGIWDYLSAAAIAAGPRRVELKDGEAVLHELRVPHAPLLSTDEPPLEEPGVVYADGLRFVWKETSGGFGNYVWVGA